MSEKEKPTFREPTVEERESRMATLAVNLEHFARQIRQMNAYHKRERESGSGELN